MATAEATIIMAIFAVCSAIAAIPAGKLGRKIGRKKTILAGLTVFITAFLVFFLVFTIMVSSSGISVGKYIQANKLYANVDSAITTVNTELSEAHKAGLTSSTGEYEPLTISGYVEYLETMDQESVYAKVTDALVESSGGNFSLDNFVNTCKNVLGKEVADGDYAEALANIQQEVDSKTKILKVLIYPVLILAGFANMFITVNTLPLVLEIGGIDKVGTFTGYYYTATFSAQIASPIVYGMVAMVSGTYMSLFYYSPIAFVVCVGLLMFVKHGEAIPQEVIDKIEDENND